MTMTNAEKAAVLRGAARLIREKGLEKGMFRGLQGSANCSHCAMGAIADAAEPALLNQSYSALAHWRDLLLPLEPVLNEFAAYLVERGLTHRRADDYYYVISDFNDRPDRTAEDVAGHLDALAEKLEAS